MKTQVQAYRATEDGVRMSNAAETLTHLRDGVARPFDETDRVFCMRMLRDVAAQIIAGGE